MVQDPICTPFELKQFAFSLSGDNPTAFNFARFIESKSSFKYTVIEIEFLLDTFKMLEECVQFSNSVNESFRNKWKDVNIPMVKLF